MTSELDRVLDDIDTLVDEQIARYPNRSGYDHNVAQERCPHCGRHWHGLPLTAAVAAMYVWGCYDDSYRPDEDTSPVVCEGSTFIGPVRSQLAAMPTPQFDRQTLDASAEATWIWLTAGNAFTYTGIVIGPTQRVEFPTENVELS